MGDRMRRAVAGIGALATMMIVGADGLSGQQVADFDVDRLYMVDRGTYVPFRVETTQPLRQALEDGRLDEETSVLVMDHGEAGRLALATDQMAYHHVAQGEIAGEPWMVSF